MHLTSEENTAYFDFSKFDQFIIWGLLFLLLSLLYWRCLWGMGFNSRRCFVKNAKCKIYFVTYSYVIQCLFPLWQCMHTIQRLWVSLNRWNSPLILYQSRWTNRGAEACCRQEFYGPKTAVRCPSFFETLTDTKLI